MKSFFIFAHTNNYILILFMKFNPLDNYSMEEIEKMLQNVIEVEEFSSDVQHVILIADDFDELEIDMSAPEEPSTISNETTIASQRK